MKLPLFLDLRYKPHAEIGILIKVFGLFLNHSVNRNMPSRQDAKKNIGVLISDHNVRDTMNICSKVIVVNKGRVIANGKPEEIATNSLVKEVYLGQNFEA